MAIGINKYEHRRLMERLGKLSKEDSDSSQWQDLEKELTEAYDQMTDLIYELEQSAVRYKRLNEEVHPQVSLALRKLKKVNAHK